VKNTVRLKRGEGRKREPNSFRPKMAFQPKLPKIDWNTWNWLEFDPRWNWSYFCSVLHTDTRNSTRSDRNETKFITLLITDSIVTNRYFEFSY